MDAMGIWSTEWAKSLFLEAMRFWFYSISFSIVLNLVLLYSAIFKATGSLKRTKGSGETRLKVVESEVKQANVLQRNLLKKLAIDCCDIFIPGFTTGWLVLSSGFVGILGMISTVLASTDIWKRVQRPS